MSSLTDSPIGAQKVTLEDFEWGEKLGEGSYGTVSLATLKNSTSKFAVKILSKKQLIKENKVQWVSRERNILNMLNHPFVVKLYYALQDPQNLYFVMEYCPGGELFDLIRKHGSLHMDCAEFYTAEIVVSLEYIHTRGVIHRDLKPENILITNAKHIKLIDFGTAKDIGTRNARADSFCGTAEYVSPELLNEKPATCSSDLWALGCIIYHLITGRPPFKGKTQYQTFQLVSKRKFVYPTGFPPIGKEIINSLLVLVPEERLGSRDYSELKSHKFFKSTVWDDMENQPPPSIRPPEVKLVFPNEAEAQRQMTIAFKRKQTLPFTILDLSEEYLFKVFYYLSFWDLIRVCEVCKRFQHATLDKRLWDPWFRYYSAPLESGVDQTDSSNIETELEGLQVSSSNEVIAGSVNKLVDFLLDEKGQDFSFQRTFLLTYQTFMTPQALLLALFRRYNYIYPVLPRLLRMCSVLKTWLDVHFYDFDQKMILALKVFIRAKLAHDAQAVVARSLAVSLDKKLHPRNINRTSATIAPPPRVLHLAPGSSWLEIPEEEIARQLTLIDFARFKLIRPSEFFDRNWMKSPDQALKLSPNVSNMIRRFNLVTKWVPSVIVQCEKLRDRVKVLARMIRIAAVLRDLNNFNGLMALMAGLHSGTVSRLKFTFEDLPKTEKRIFRQLEEEMGLEDETVHRRYREILLKIKPPCIPYLGMIVKDLLLVETGTSSMQDGMINFQKRRQMYNVISMLEQYTTCDYVLTEVPDVQSVINSFQPMDDNGAFKLSQKIEPRGAKKSDIVA